MKRIWFLIQKNYKIFVLSTGLIVFTGYSDSSGSIEKLETVSNFRTAMGKKYNEALLYFLSNKWITDTIAANNIDPDFARAIVFPELVRYSWLQNEMEMAGLFSLYIQYGENYANFSVGRFQMKPSFVSRLESDALKAGILRFSAIEKLGEISDSESRLQRVKRLDSPLWQTRYLITFIKVLDRMYASKKWSSVEEKLKFFASAYNCGYWQSEKSIQRQVERKLFYVSLLSDSRYCYANISYELYLFFKANS